jgi:hypothetical protein
VSDGRILDGTGLLAVDTASCRPAFPANVATNTHGTRATADPPLGGVRTWKCRMGFIGMKNADLLGWISSFNPLLTLLRQVYVQWKSESVAGVSKWPFVGQLAASTGIWFKAKKWL